MSNLTLFRDDAFEDVIASELDAYDDKIKGNSRNNLLVGNAGNDIIIGGFGSDVIDGGQGHDLLYGGFPIPGFLEWDDSPDIILGGAGNDLIQAGGGNDLVDGEEGDDFIYDVGGTLWAPSNDILFGSEGQDYIDGGTGKNLLVGGADCDLLLGDWCDTKVQGDLEPDERDQVLNGYLHHFKDDYRRADFNEAIKPALGQPLRAKLADFVSPAPDCHDISALKLLLDDCPHLAITYKGPVDLTPLLQAPKGTERVLDEETGELVELFAEHSYRAAKEDWTNDWING